MSESELEEIIKANVEFKAWYAANLAPRVETLDYTTQSVVENATFYGWLAAKGFDLDRALTEDFAKLIKFPKRS